MSNHNPLPYFSPLLSWQERAWTQVTHQFYAGKLPHGLLAGGMAGIGKRTFVWRFVAWLLCTHKHEQGACGACESCTWLRAGTHPDVMVLPAQSLPTFDHDEQDTAIKIDEVRALQEYSHVKGHGVRLIVLDHAETLTVGASNALLKTLEEPHAGVHLFLISDNPSKLLPTIKSRVQALPLTQISHTQALSYVVDKLGDEALARLALDLADGAVLRAVDLPKAVWFDKRTLWLKTWLALRHGQRLPVGASDYWQGEMALAEFVVLTRLMLIEMMRIGLGLQSRHSDIEVKKLIENEELNPVAIEQFLTMLDEMMVAVGQNVQDKMAYDVLFCQLARL